MKGAQKGNLLLTCPHVKEDVNLLPPPPKKDTPCVLTNVSGELICSHQGTTKSTHMYSQAF